MLRNRIFGFCFVYGSHFQACKGHKKCSDALSVLVGLCFNFRH